MAGIARAKVMPVARLSTFVESGAGASPCWNVFCVDDHIAFTPTLSVVGDLRLRIDAADLRDLGGGTYWAPADLVDQDGSPWPACPRHTLRRTTQRLTAAGIEARVGHEVEFTLFDALDPQEWSAYGLNAALRKETFIRDLLDAAATAGLTIEQVHAEYGLNQYEISLGPDDPIAAADNAVLARILVSRVARTHDLRASFAPVPVAGGAGNGAHHHISLHRGDQPMFSGGSGPHALTVAGAHAVAGILAALPDFVLVLAGSALSHLRLQPNTWGGAYTCWGLENREAAVRLCADTPGNPRGAHIEVKPVDPSANPYLAGAVVLGAALAGIDGELPLPPEVTVNPSLLPDGERTAAGVALLPSLPADLLGRLQASSLAGDLFEPLLLEALLAVKGYELSEYGRKPPAEVAQRLRFAWTM
ncbi:glutamine synthetase [Rhodococcus spelaei]|uniref:Glutamine synthetase n=1 Tax=Rhodococcus spelaei TaxID=2546320 RepID=A0A541B2H1_9NOCA|nr:glutamine synthetase family protein [Rhodococcus spelaei]TQF66523.1 glutamine synthetase [Rhodococcus spelaei]